MVRVMNRISIDNRVKLYREIENHLQDPNHTLFDSMTEVARYFTQRCEFNITAGNFKSMGDLPIHKLVNHTRQPSGGLSVLWHAVKTLEERVIELEKVVEEYK